MKSKPHFGKLASDLEGRGYIASEKIKTRLKFLATEAAGRTQFRRTWAGITTAH